MEPFHITPDPSDEEREAILAALGADGEEQPTVSPWAEALLPLPGKQLRCSPGEKGTAPPGERGLPPALC